MTSTTSNVVKLSATSVLAWKETVINRALDLNALDILSGDEVMEKPGTSGSSEDKKEWREYCIRVTGMAGYIRSTLDLAQITSVLKGVENDNPKDMYNTLLEYYQPKTSQSRAAAFQELLSVRKTEDESYGEFGARVVSLGSEILARCPGAPTYVPEQTDPIQVPDTTTEIYPDIDPTSTTAIKLLKHSLYLEGYTAADLIGDLITAMVIIGLPNDGDSAQLRHTLTHTDSDGSPEDTLNHLRKADGMKKNNELAEEVAHAASSKAKSSKSKDKKSKSSKAKFNCKEHGPNSSHGNEDCIVQKRKAKEQKEKQAAGNAAREDYDEEETPEETAMLSATSHIASAPRYRQKHDTADTKWNADSGATSHMTPHIHWMRNMKPCRVPVKLANNHRVYAAGRGSVVFQPSGNREAVVFKDVLHVPKLCNNLFSILSTVKKSKARVVIEGDTLEFSKEGKDLFTATIQATTGILDGVTLDNDEQAYATAVDKSIWHERLGHIGKDRLDTLLRNNLADGIAVKPGTELNEFCEACISGKQHRQPFPKASQNRSTELLGRAHSDLHGPLPRTIDGFLYWITFTDDCSRIKGVYNLKRKSEAFAKFKEWVARVELETGKKLKEFQEDKGGEYMSKEWEDWMKERGIKRRHTVKGTPQQNGVAERLNRTLAEGVVAMINHAGLPVSWWKFAVLYYAEILNVTPTSSLAETTSHEVWNKKRPDLTMFRVFGCRAWVNVHKDYQKNLDSHTLPCIFIGFAPGYKGWLCYDPVKRKQVISGDVIFNERSFPGLSTKGKEVVIPPAKFSDLWFHKDDQSTQEKPTKQRPDAPPSPSNPSTT